MVYRNKRLHSRLLGTTIFAGAMLSAAPAFAQPTQPTEPAQTGPLTDQTTQDQAAEGGEVIVTGTLIRNPNLVSSSPVSVIGEDEIDLQQANTAEELLRELPGAVPSIGSAVNNGNGGSSFVNLRGLGSNRNIVLLDGVRLVPAELNGRFDLNNVPLALIQRVDVLTGGASTTYGADAVSGVVNFITRQDFSGIDINLSEQITERGDGNVLRADVTIGANLDDGRGNVVLSIGYQEADPVFQGGRDISVFQFDSFSGGGGGSGTSVPSRFTGVNPTGTDFVTGGTNQGTRQVSADGTSFRPTAAFDPFNFNPFNVFQTPFERFNIYGAANYEISDAIEIYTRGLFSKNTVDTIIAPSGAFAISVVVPLNNPFLTPALRNGFCQFDTNNGVGFTPRFTPAECAAAATATGPTDPNYRQVTTTLSRRAVEVGPRISNYVTQIFDYRVGARGGITDTIDYDLFGSYGESDNLQTILNYTLNSRVRQGLLTTGLGAAATCRDTSNNCVPVNFFGPAGSISPQAASFLTAASTVLTRTTLSQARGTISGDFGLVSPFANDPISFAVAGEFREYRASQQSDTLAQGGDLGGAGGAAPNIDGGYDVYEAFGELIVPLVQDRPFFRELTLEAGARFSDYSVAAPGDPTFDTFTWKVGGAWSPVEGVRFRGNYARASRAPNVAELFSPVNTTLTNLSDDPCANLNDSGAPIPGRATPTGELRAICLAQGAPVNTIGSIAVPTAGQANSTGGGNLQLEPEESTSYTVGAVFQPDFIPGLSFSVDYYNIEITGAITSPTPDDAITGCFGTSPQSPAAGSSTREACTIIRRDPVTGALSGDPNTTPGLFLSLSNLGLLQTSGVDFTFNYQRDLGFAGFALSALLNWTDESVFEAVEGVSGARDCVGLYSSNCGSIQPEYQWSVRGTFTFGDNIDVSLLWRHIDSVTYEFADSAPAFVGTVAGFGEVDFNEIEAYDYFDLSTRFQVNDNFTFSFSVQNLLDKDPPLVGNTIGSTAFNSGNTYPSTYDSLGRRFVASARIRF